jgi:hypothetical protein
MAPKPLPGTVSAILPGLATVDDRDRQGWITVVAGLLLALITLFTSYDHVDLPVFGSVRIDQQIGVPLLVASLATLAVDVELASRSRSRAQSDRAREADRAAEERVRAAEERVRADQERDRAAEERERALRRAQRQDRCTLVQLRFQLDPSAAHARQLADLIALLQEYGDLA